MPMASQDGQMTSIKEKLPIECSLCKKEYSTEGNLKRHLQQDHNVHSVSDKHLKCAFCEFLVTTTSKYDIHLREKHAITVSSQTLTFSTLEEFNKWKHTRERDANEQFRKIQEYSTKSADKKYVYSCTRSGLPRLVESRERYLKIQGSRKIGVACPARIVLEKTREKFIVTYISTHVHEKDIKHLSLSEQERMTLAGYLSLGMSKVSILKKIHDSWSDENENRFHFTTHKDLRNICRDFKIDAEVIRDQNDLTSVESWVNENQDKVLTYQAPTDGHEFHLGIATQYQREMLVKYGSEGIVAIDSTHGTNDYDFQLTTLMVVDENGSGFPGAFFYSARVDTSACAVFFESIKQRIGLIHAVTFMSDDYPAYFNAWSRVMSSPKNHLLCTWHVIRNWNKHLSLVSDSNLRAEMRSHLREMQYELDAEQFNTLLKFFKVRYGANKDSKKFVEYIESNYCNRIELWAFCHRRSLGINTNMHLENLHSQLKHLYMGGKKVRRMDVSIDCLMKMVESMKFQRKIHETKGYIPTKLADLRHRHKDVPEEGYQVLENDGTDPSSAVTILSGTVAAPKLYKVKILRDLVCKCLLKCIECNVCIKQASCECVDYCIKGNMCKHIHYVASKIIKESHQEAQFDNVPETPLYPLTEEIEPNDTAADSFETAFDSTLDKPSPDQPSTSMEDSVDFQKEQNKIVSEFISIVQSCQSLEELKAIRKFMLPMTPTINALRLSQNAEISQTRGSQGTKRNIEKQARFVTKKKKVVRRNIEKAKSTMVNELFASQKEVQFDHGYSKTRVESERIRE